MSITAFLLLTVGAALAEEPTVTVDGATVRGSAVLEVPATRFLAALRDPAWEGQVAGDGTEAHITGSEGGCQIVSYSSPNSVATATYVLRRCPTADGWESSLVRSNTFTAYRSRWTVTPAARACRVSFEVELSVSAWVPDSLVQSQTVQSIQRRLQALQAWASGQPKE